MDTQLCLALSAAQLAIAKNIEIIQMLFDAGMIEEAKELLDKTEETQKLIGELLAQ